MTFQVDKALHWTDHYVEHGFAVINGAIGDDFIKPALQEVEQAINNGLPRSQWTTENTPTRSPVDVTKLSVLPRVYDQPGVRRMIDTMFGSPGEWDAVRGFQLFISPFDPKAPAALSPEGHIDFVNSPVPIYGSGFICQVSLVKSEPFSGNITIYPGAHKKIQKALVENPDLQWPGDILNPFLKGEPYEFVAEPGDMLIFHHLVGHAGNSNHAAGRSPRVVLHCLVGRKAWLREQDPATPGLSPWARSLGFTGGRYRTRQDEEQWITEFHRKAREKKQVQAAAM